ncbi:hypothetical protein DFH27DRAFT_485270 [Peziza echinospora]|nr:hypothetical protein DFH27DRAFT_485270 [Peziza echinospora]
MQLGGPGPRSPQGLGLSIASPTPNPYEFESPRPPPPYQQPGTPKKGSRRRNDDESRSRSRSRGRRRSRSRSSIATTITGTATTTPVIRQSQYFRPGRPAPTPPIQQQQIRQLQVEQFRFQPPAPVPPLQEEEAVLRPLTPPPQPAFARRPTRPEKTDWWAWETSALFLSLLAIGGIVTILILFDGEPIPAWSMRGPGVSVNTLLSVLSTLSRTSLLIPLDDCLGQLMWVRLARRRRKPEEGGNFGMASQGIWGCVRLFWRHGGVSLASAGCLLTVLSLGLGPATQQLLSYPSRLIVDPRAVSMVTYASSYDVTPSGDGAVSRGGVLGETVMALYTGGTSGGTGISPQYTCSSGSCTYPSFTTLGVCSECHVVPGVPCSSIPGNRQFCRANYMNGTITALRGRGYTTLFNQSSIAPRISQRLKDLEPWPIAALATLHLARFEGGAFITECALVWCVKQISGRVVNGVYMENTTRVDVGPAFTRTVGQNNRMMTITRNPQVPMNVTQLPTVVSAAPIIEVVTDKLTGFVERNLTRTGVSSDLMHVLSEGGKTPGQVFEGFAIALTKLVRDRATRQGQVPITGETWILQSFIRANWIWLAYPAAMWLFSATFLTSVICVSRNAKKKLGVPVWGGSWLAAVLVGVDDSVARRARDMASVLGEPGGVLSRDGMRKLGRETKVRLSTSGGDGIGGGAGLRLRLVRETSTYDV